MYHIHVYIFLEREIYTTIRSTYKHINKTEVFIFFLKMIKKKKNGSGPSCFTIVRNFKEGIIELTLGNKAKVTELKEKSDYFSNLECTFFSTTKTFFRVTF